MRIVQYLENENAKYLVGDQVVIGLCDKSKLSCIIDGFCEVDDILMVISNGKLRGLKLNEIESIKII